MAVENRPVPERLRNLLTVNSASIAPQTLNAIREEARTEIKEALAQSDSVKSVQDGLRLLGTIDSSFTKLTCYLDRIQLVNSNDPPDIKRMARKYSAPTAKNDPALVAQGKQVIQKNWKVLCTHLVDNLHLKKIRGVKVFDRHDCPGCIGDCVVQRARTTTIRFHEPSAHDPEENEIIPCITAGTIKIPKFSIVDIRYVRIILFVHQERTPVQDSYKIRLSSIYIKGEKLCLGK